MHGIGKRNDGCLLPYERIGLGKQCLARYVITSGARLIDQAVDLLACKTAHVRAAAATGMEQREEHAFCNRALRHHVQARDLIVPGTHALVKDLLLELLGLALDTYGSEVLHNLLDDVLVASPARVNEAEGLAAHALVVCGVRSVEQLAGAGGVAHGIGPCGISIARDKRRHDTVRHKMRIAVYAAHKALAVDGKRERAAHIGVIEGRRSNVEGKVARREVGRLHKMGAGAHRKAVRRATVAGDGTLELIDRTRRHIERAGQELLIGAHGV